MNLIQINDIEIPSEVKEFAFDGCHKFYLIVGGEKGKETLREKGWDDNDFYPMEKLEHFFYNSCPLRFINYDHTKGLETIVPQFEEKVVFKYDNGEEHVLNFEEEF